MNEKDKIMIFNQLIKFTDMAGLGDDLLMDKQDFIKLEPKAILEYAFAYRDRCAEEYDKKRRKSKRKKLYLELPNMDLSGQDLKDFYLHDFTPGYAVQRQDGKKVFVTTTVNLKDTGCVINMGTLRPIVISKDGKKIDEIVADITKCDFRGCKLFGKYQNSKAKLDYTDSNLPKEYIERLSKYEVPNSAELTSADVYIAMMENKPISGIKGLNNVKQLVDYDMTEIEEGIWKYRTIICNRDIDISYTGAFIRRFGVDSVGNENYLINFEKQARDAYLKGDMEYVESVFKELSKEARKGLVGLALKDGKTEFVAKHEKELNMAQKKYLDLKSVKDKTNKARDEVKDKILKLYQEKNRPVDLQIEMLNAEEVIRTDIVKKLYSEGDIEFARKFLPLISDSAKAEIIRQEYNNKNYEFVSKVFKEITDKTIKQKIINMKMESNEWKFLYENYDYFDNEDLKKKIMKQAIKDENAKFVNKYFSELPKEMQVDAALKIKGLNLSQEELMGIMN